MTIRDLMAMALRGNIADSGQREHIDDDDGYPEGLPPSAMVEPADGDPTKFRVVVRGRRSMMLHRRHDEARKEAWERHWFYEKDERRVSSVDDEAEARVLYMRAMIEAEDELQGRAK